jgi:hypothetical protein
MTWLLNSYKVSTFHPFSAWSSSRLVRCLTSCCPFHPCHASMRKYVYLHPTNLLFFKLQKMMTVAFIFKVSVRFQDKSEGSKSACRASAVRGIWSVVCTNLCQFCTIKCSMMEERMSMVRLLTNAAIYLCCVLGNLIERRQCSEF